MGSSRFMNLGNQNEDFLPLFFGDFSPEPFERGLDGWQHLVGL